MFSHLATLYPHESLSLEIISRKLVTFLALTIAQHMQTLVVRHFFNVFFSDLLIIKIPANCKLKTSGIERSQPLLIFKPFFRQTGALHFFFDEILS